MDKPVPSDGSPSTEPIRNQLRRILSSGAFSNAPVLSRLLSYIVEHQIGGVHTPLKEYTIGVEVLRRGASFDPHLDTIVRVHARRLRERLERYYENEGHGDPLLITVPKGHYQVKIVAQSSAAETAAGDANQITRQKLETGPWRKTSRSSAVPAPRTPIVGRATELAQLCAMLADEHGPRLVTLTGPAGSGKTRLAIEVGLSLQKQLPNDVMYVPLAAIADAHTLQLELLHALGLRAVDNTPALETLCGHLHDTERALTLILDNFEQLADTAPLIGTLLDACTLLRVVVTSRVALHLYGEWEHPVLPLALPERDSMSLEELATVPAVELFIRRAAAVRPGFSLNTGNAGAITLVCQHFEGLPLGIELAAAQCRALTPAQLLQRFPARLNVTASNTADVPDRQRTLRHAIEWSYRLLTESDRTLLRRLSVFSGGFTQQAASAVANLRGDADAHVVSGVGRLLDNNLLRSSPSPNETRYSMLETIREYGFEQLLASGEEGDVARAHAKYCLELAETGTAHPPGAALDDWLARCDQEQDNFRVVLHGLVNRGYAREALRLVRALHLYWDQRGYLAAGKDAILLVLERFEPSVAPALWGEVACCAAAVEHQMGSLEAAMEHCERALAAARGYGDEGMESTALNSIKALKGFDSRRGE